MNISNKIMLITYPDSMGGNLESLNHALNTSFKGAVGGVHILPFFPSSGDRGFSPVTYDMVEPAFGDWSHIGTLSENYYLMCDMMVNHVSKRSREFLDYMERGDESPYKDLFLDYAKFWGEGKPDEHDIQILYRRKDGEPYQDFIRKDGKKVRLWCTFTQEQIDLDIRTNATKEYLKNSFHFLASKGINVIRLDALGYAVKKRETSCFMVEPDIWDFIKEVNSMAGDSVWLLPEIHDTWQTAKKLEKNQIWSYDFVLPFLMLHSLYSGDTESLKGWLDVAPRTQFTVLDTHDGIGVYDAFDWVNEGEAEELITRLEDRLSYSYKPLNPEKKRFKKAYQLYTTYFSALHENEKAYLLARAVQFFAPGIPQVYYVGMLAGENDYEELQKNDDHRSINRHNYSVSELEACAKKDVVKKLTALMRFRNTCEAFDGDLSVTIPAPGMLRMVRTGTKERAELLCNFKTYEFSIQYTEQGILRQLTL
ncbi:sucrose phosphorylase [Lacrimispora aerotolerans]|uniref:sucrose phosphorylase n=1 Tax=Lacrimispora aerotolerans TaxID=36832 RepID=UPI0004794476|nr:sucrose phosphorylase [Lacrimispora aerotolerans]